MIHSAKFGSIERFIGLLIEHYGGAFPVWLSPVQAVGVPVSLDHLPYLEQVAAQFRAAGVRVEVDAGGDRMQKKIRHAQTQKVPDMLIAGQADADAGAVSLRLRDGTQHNGLPVAQAIAEVTAAIRERR
jgi:threonyl-tRNA synthetase